MLTLKKPKKSLGYTEAEVKQMLWEVFQQWHNGQTAAIDDDTGESLYYPQDVQPYVVSTARKQPIVWD